MRSKSSALACFPKDICLPIPSNGENYHGITISKCVGKPFANLNQSVQFRTMGSRFTKSCSCGNWVPGVGVGATAGPLLQRQDVWRSDQVDFGNCRQGRKSAGVLTCLAHVVAGKSAGAMSGMSSAYIAVCNHSWFSWAMTSGNSCTKTPCSLNRFKAPLHFWRGACETLHTWCRWYLESSASQCLHVSWVSGSQAACRAAVWKPHARSVMMAR